jgi:hypothetical protein
MIPAEDDIVLFQLLPVVPLFHAIFHLHKDNKLETTGLCHLQDMEVGTKHPFNQKNSF